MGASGAHLGSRTEASDRREGRASRWPRGGWVAPGGPRQIPLNPCFLTGEMRERDQMFSEVFSHLNGRGASKVNLPLLPSGRRRRGGLRYTGCSPQTGMLLHSARQWEREGAGSTCEMPAGLQRPARPLRQATLAPAPDTAGLATVVLGSEASPDS